MKKLTAKEQAFVGLYLADKHLNASEAARKAGYSAKTAGNIANQLLKKPHIADAIMREMDERGERTKITADDVLININRLACKAEALMDFGAALRGQEMLGKHHKLFTDKVEHSGEVTVQIMRYGSNPAS